MRIKTVTAFLLSAGLLFGCNSQDTGQPLNTTFLHVNDTQSNLAPQRIDLSIQGINMRAQIGGAPRAIHALKQLHGDRTNVIRLHAGNSITGNAFFTLFEGEADADFMKLACFDAIGLGSHDFNAGEVALKSVLDYIAQGSCVTEYLSSNIEFKVGDSPLARIKKDDLVKAVTIKYIDNEPVGIISVIPARKTSQSSSPNPSTKFLKEQKTAQKLIKRLQKSGVNKIVMLSQLGLEADIELASKLKGIDVIIGSGSHTLMGEFDNIGLKATTNYPLRHIDADDNLVCIAHAWHHYAGVGELHVSWNAAGEVSSCEGQAHLLIDTPHSVKNTEGKYVPISPSQKRIALNALTALSPLIPAQADSKAESVLGQFESRIERTQSNVIAKVKQNLCLERIPGQGYSKLCDVTETNTQGSHITSIVAKAFLQATRTSDISIQNAGGVRSDIKRGDLTLGDAHNLLPFGNVLVELSMTGDEIKQVLEDAVTYSVSEGGTTGGFPYAAGLRWNLDMTKAANKRISKVEINPRLESEWQAIKPSQTYQVVTNNYIAQGRDGYKTFGAIIKDGRYRDTYIYYTQAFVDYARKVKNLDRPPAAEMSIQKLVLK